MGHCNLLLHYNPYSMFQSDFEGMAERIRRRAPDISVMALKTHKRHPVAMARAALGPTVSVEFKPPRAFHYRRGKVFRQTTGQLKSQECQILKDAGIPVPSWTPIVPGTRLDPDEWGPLVVEKPEIGVNGAYVRVRRTGKVRCRPPEDLEEDNPGREGGLIAQKLIFTGLTPVSYRVLTLFGTPLMAMRYDGSRPPSFVEDPDGGRKHVGSSIVATGKGCTLSLCFDQDILDLARQAHGAFSDVPVLGVDIVRDADDGSLWVLEVNPRGGSWIFGSPTGDYIMKTTGLDFYGQFGALDRAAETLVEVCRQAAE